MPDSPRDSHAILRRHIARIGVDAFAAPSPTLTAARPIHAGLYESLCMNSEHVSLAARQRKTIEGLKANLRDYSRRLAELTMQRDIAERELRAASIEVRELKKKLHNLRAILKEAGLEQAINPALLFD